MLVLVRVTDRLVLHMLPASEQSVDIFSTVIVPMQTTLHICDFFYIRQGKRYACDGTEDN